jgi:hypothetical protein
MATVTQAASDNEGTPYKNVPRQQLTQQQLRSLKSGQKIHILLLDPEGNRYIAVEGAWAKVLMHYSQLVRDRFSNGPVTNIVMVSGDEAAYVWAYRYMAAGQHDFDPTKKFEQINVLDLIKLHHVCEQLMYEHLTAKTWNRLVYLIKNDGPYMGIDDLNSLATSLPGLIDVIAEMMFRYIIAVSPPWDQNHTTYLIKEFGFDKSVEETLIVKINILGEAHLAWLKEQQDRAAQKARKTHAPTNPKGISAPGAGEKDKKSTMICYSCSQVGHVRRNCPVPKTKKVVPKEQASSKPINQKQQVHSGLVCYKCNKVGHLARQCRSAPHGNKLHGPHGGSLPQYQAQPASNGHGLTTYERELKPGQKTRLGLMV